LRAARAAAIAVFSFAALAADYPAPKQGDWIARDFKFHRGEMASATANRQSRPTG
jgi:homoserine O-acetyltransferase